MYIHFQDKTSKTRSRPIVHHLFETGRTWNICHSSYLVLYVTKFIEIYYNWVSSGMSWVRYQSSPLITINIVFRLHRFVQNATKAEDTVLDIDVPFTSSCRIQLLLW